MASRSTNTGRRLLRIGLIAFTAIVTLWAFGRLGSLLVVSDPLEKADAIVVFGGGLPFRAMEAAKIYNEGWAPQVWLSQGENTPEVRMLKQFDIGFLGEGEYSGRVLEKFGVPHEAIYTLDPAVNTTAEVQLIIERLKTTGGKRAILVSSKAHTRRIRITWHAVVGKDFEGIVRYTTEDPYRPDRWWANSRDAFSVTREIGGIMNAWAGFPLKAARE